MKIKKTCFYISIFFTGFFCGIFWYRHGFFPLSQIKAYKAYLEEQNALQNVKILPYKQGTPLFCDRKYIEHIGDKRLENLYLLQIPRHYNGLINIRFPTKTRVYRMISKKNDNFFLENEKWEKSNIEIIVVGNTCNHELMVEKDFPANENIVFSSGGPFASSPILLKIVPSNIDTVVYYLEKYK